jgi:hypothetical protein
VKKERDENEQEIWYRNDAERYQTEQSYEYDGLYQLTSA